MEENNPNPFILNAQTGRAYYGKSIGLGDQNNLWTDNPYQSGFRESHSYTSRVGTLAAAGAGYAALTASPWAWEQTTQFVRALEDRSPFKWGRTFQLSNILSHREKAVLEAQAKPGGAYFKDIDSTTRSYLQRLTGKTLLDGKPEEGGVRGVTLKDGKLYANQFVPGGNNRVLLEHAGVIRMQEGSSNTFGQALQRILGIPEPSSFNALEVERKLPNRAGAFGTGNVDTAVRPSIGGMPIQFIGGATKAQYHLRRAGALAAEFGIYRFNRLLTEDFQETPFTRPIANALKNLPAGLGKYFEKGLGVKATTPLNTGLRLGGKLAAIGTVVPLAYEQLDWMTEKILGMGITEGLATAGVAAHIGYSHVIDMVGIPGVGDLYDLQEGLENWVPGLTSPYNLPKFALGGFATGMMATWGYETQAGLRRNPGSIGASDYWEKYTDTRANLSRRYTDFMFEPGHKIGGLFEKWGTARTGSIREANETWVGDLWRRMTTVAKEGDLKPGETAKKLLDIHLPTPFGDIGLGRATVGKLTGLMGAAAGAALTVIPSGFGLLVPDERPEELEAIYSGRKEVAVRRGRFWEFGRGSYEGDDIMYYRPHAFARMKSKYKEKALWGDEYDLSPLRKFYLQEFTYHLEKKHYEDRPYTTTSLPLEDVAFLGPILSNTIGRLIKPVLSMHSEDWRDGSHVKVAAPQFGKTYATELGETPGGVPVNPYGLTQTLSNIWYQLSEQAGLWGYALEGLNKGLTGTTGIFDQDLVASSFRDVTSATRDFYDLGLGGMAMTNEAFRRLFPAERNHIDTYNPIRNTMPGWMPGPGSRGIDFQHGDPYTKIAEGEYRLPGRGYAARFEELEGVDPEDYPLIHKFKILADVAPFSREFKQIAQQAKQERDSFNSFDRSIYEATLQQLDARKERKRFDEYRNSFFGQGDKYGAEESSEILAAINRGYANNSDQTTGIMGGIGSVLEWALHAQTPVEYFTPLAPESKFNPRRTSIESYEREQVYGTNAAFWNKPFDNFIRPALYSISNQWLGYEGIPDRINKIRDMEEYFDILEYVKYTRLSNIAAINKDSEAKAIFERRKDETLFGINPYTENESKIFRSLPSRDKAYFRAFSNADSPEERKRILELIPRNQRELYLARWKLQQTQDMRSARDNMLDQSIQGNVIEDRINNTYDEARTEGLPKTPELHQLFMSTKFPGENYPDWYRRTQLLPDVPLPGADWIGWHPSVDLEDIKLKMVVNEGENIHDYGFYDTQLRTLGSKPFLDEAVQGVLSAGAGNELQTRRLLSALFAEQGMNAEIGVRKQWGTNTAPRFQVELER